MKRFVLKLFLFAVPVILFFLAMNALYERTNYWKSKDYANKYTDAPYGIELGNLGSSIPCFAIKYDVAPQIKAWNFANLNEVFYWNYRILRHYIGHFSEGAIVLIDIPFFGISVRPESSQERYYRTLPKEDMAKWTFSKWLAYKKFPLLSSGVYKAKIFHDISKEEMSPFYERDSAMSEERLYQFAQSAYNMWAGPSDEAYKMNLAEVDAIIDLCLERKLRPVLITVPQTDCVNALYESEGNFFDRFERFTRELQEKHPGLVYLDYSRDKNFTAHHEYFKDAVHMNNIGAEKFTLTLINDLRSKGLLNN